jgi:DNA-directed RNA polymerase II subunit RPB2
MPRPCKSSKGVAAGNVCVQPVGKNEFDNSPIMADIVRNSAIVDVKPKKNKKVSHVDSPVVKPVSDPVPFTEVETVKSADLLGHMGKFVTEPFAIIESYFKGNEHGRLIRHQVESTNYFIKHQMQATINMFNPRRVVSDEDYNIDTGDHNLSVSYSISNLKFYPPQLYENNGATKPMFPQEARLRNFTYASKSTVDIHFTIAHRYDTEATNHDMNAMRTTQFTIPGIKFIDMPIMVGSSNCIVDQYKRNFHSTMDECPRDCGGYFIVKGSDKVVIGQEHAAENRPYVFLSKKPKWDFIAEYRSVPDTKCISPKQMEMAVSTKTNIYGHGIHVTLPRMRQKVSVELFVLFRALGITSDKQICDIIVLGVDNVKKAEMLRYLEASIYDASQYVHERENICEDAFAHFMTTVSYNIYTKQKTTKIKQSIAPTLDTNNTTDKTDESTGIMSDFMNNYLEATKQVKMPPMNQTTLLNHTAQLRELLRRTFQVTYPMFCGLATTGDDMVSSNETEFMSIHTHVEAMMQIMRYSTQYKTTFRNCASFSVFFLNIIRGRKTHTQTAKSTTKKREYTRDILNNELFPHCKTQTQKIYLLGTVANRLIQTALGWVEPADRDSYINKRIELTGTLINNLFRNLYSRFIKEFDKHIVREIDAGSWTDPSTIVHSSNIHKMFIPNTVENGINRALSTGDFSVKQSGGNNKVGVAQVLSRLNNAAVLSHIRRINTPLEKTGELIAPRKLHGTTAGFLCPIETPESHSVGVVKQIGMLTHVTIPTQSSFTLYDEVAPYITELELDNPGQYGDKVKVFINGTWLGVAKDPLTCYRDLKDKKYRGIINVYTSVIFDIPKLEIRLCTDAGRLCRPVLRVRDNKVLITREHIVQLQKGKLTWHDLVVGDGNNFPESVIEYIDVEEQAYAKIGMKLGLLPDGSIKYLHHTAVEPRLFSTIRYTHCEIHPSIWFGVIASCIPFPHFNQSPRNAYQTAMGKQAMGVTSTNNVRMDKTAYEMNYPSKPLVNTRMADILNMNSLPSGCQVHVAIMSYTGYNQEDSVLINQAAVDRGLFVTTVYHTEKDDDKNSSRDEVVRCVPDKTNTRGMKMGNYSKLNKQTGFNPENTHIINRDMLWGKKVQIKENRGDPTKIFKFEDQSRICRTHEDTYIDRNFTGRNGEGYNFAKVRTRTFRKMNIGDKLASRSAQKGTAGMIMAEEDMPFTADGIRPDIILNPHAIPSRMTIAQLVETLIGKLLLELGLFGDGTCFGDISVENIIEALGLVGFQSHGNEIMYDGFSGKQIEASIFVGPVYYQRLKHMVNDKEHSRSIGPMVNLTRQPADGRSRDGGFRVGEMERDVFIAHGIPEFCMDRMFYSSDKYGVHVCKKCGMIATFNNGNFGKQYSMEKFSTHECRTCRNISDFGYVNLPYAAKLLFQELQTINVAPRIMIE